MKSEYLFTKFAAQIEYICLEFILNTQQNFNFKSMCFDCCTIEALQYLARRAGTLETVMQGSGCGKVVWMLSLE